jgi:hypothetical protein
METQINGYERDRQRRSNLRQIEVVGGGVAAIQRLAGGRKLETGKRRRRQTSSNNANYRKTNTTVRNTRTLVNYSR